MELFKPYLSKNFNVKDKSFTDKRTNVKDSSVYFATLSLPCFNYYRNLFYNPQNIKIVPSYIHNILTPRRLAYWIMDDGSLQNKGLHLNTYPFTAEEVLILKITLDNIFGDNSLKSSIHNHPKGQRIYVWEEIMELIKDNVSQFMYKDMPYKIESEKFK